MHEGPTVAYLSMEIALEPALPTYAGGLGVLAGDTLRSAADVGLGVAAVTLVHRMGFFRQEIGPDGRQHELPAPWRPESHLEPLRPRVVVTIEGRDVVVRAWRYRVRGVNGHEVPVFLLDTDLPGNAPEARRLTDTLYGGDDRHRLCQEVVLGIGGIRMLRALGFHHLDRFHLNEGHAALAVLALMDEQLDADPDLSMEKAHARVQQSCVFTTHTPVPAGHDVFPLPLSRSVLGEEHCRRLADLGIDGPLNLTELALYSARYVNGVAMRHGEVSRGLFPGYPIHSITNGIHPGTWASPPFQRLFDRWVPDWRRDPASLRCLNAVPVDAIAEAHGETKRSLMEAVRNATGRAFDPKRLTLGFARRSTAYKRPTLIFRDLERLEGIAEQHGPIQLIFAGKAHPHDGEGRDFIQEIGRRARTSTGAVHVAFLPGYDMELASLLIAGVDVWLNTPVPPLEASGTSGMKAALNGVPSLSVLDGWWVEGCVEGVTGWAIGNDGDGHDLPPDERDDHHAAELYAKLEEAVMPCFYGEPGRFREIMRQAITINASYFNTHRMLLQYLIEAYRETGETPLGFGAAGGSPAWDGALE